MCEWEKGVDEVTGQCVDLYGCNKTNGIICKECKTDYVMQYYSNAGTIEQSCLYWEFENDPSNWIEGIIRYSNDPRDVRISHC